MAAQAASNDRPRIEQIQQVQARLAEAKSEFDRVALLANEGTNFLLGATLAEKAEYRLFIDTIVLTYQQHLDELGRMEDAGRHLKEIESSAALTELSGPPPYSILLVDDLRDSVQSLNAKIAAGETTREVLIRFAAEFQALLHLSEGRLRMLAEELENSRDPAQIIRLQSQRTLELARNKLAMANAAKNQTRQDGLNAELAESRQRLVSIRQQLTLAAQHVQFSQTDLDQVTRILEAERRSLLTELDNAEAEHRRNQQALAAARANLQKLRETAVETSGSTNQTARVRKSQELIELCSVQAETSAERLIVLRQILELVIQQRGLWQMRFVTFGSHEVSKLHAGYRRLERVTSLIQSARPHFVQRVDLAARLITDQRNRLESFAGLQSGVQPSQELLDCYKEAEQLAYRALRELGKMERLALRWKESLDEERQRLPFAARVRDLFAGASSFADRLWHFELFAVEDTITVHGQRITGRTSITVEKIVLALLILALGWCIAVFASAIMERIAVKRFKVEPNRASLVRRWTRVLLIMVLIVFSLLSVKIPLTVFAFMGGALAIGLGFGTQNLLKNFISGILILFERPFRVGDVLDINGKQGVVTGIGIRSSVLQLWNGTEVLIPNSTLLENNLTNWTYSNRKARFVIEVSVAYGSDTRQVSQHLLQTAQLHQQVEKNPAPEVLFSQLGEKQLGFKLRFWVDVQKHNAAQVSSDLRHMIVAALAEHNIALSFTATPAQALK